MQGKFIPNNKMATVSRTMGFISICASVLALPTLICSPLGILFAILSRDSEEGMSPNAKIGVIMCILGYIAMFAIFFYSLIQMYGGAYATDGIWGVIEAYTNDYTILYNSLFPVQ